MKGRSLWWLAGCVLVLGCNTGRQITPEQAGPGALPLAVIVDTIIGGVVLGQPLRFPSGVATDRRGVCYVIDQGNNRLLRLDPRLTPLRQSGGYGSQGGYFDRPGLVAVDNDLNLVITDQGNHRLTYFNSRLEYAGEISLDDETEPLKYGRPTGVAVTDFGEIWMADADNNRLVIFDQVGRFKQFVGDQRSGAGELLRPGKISRHDDLFYVCDAGNRRVLVFDEYGNYLSEIRHESLSDPAAAIVDREQMLWVVDRETGRLFCFDRQAQLVLVAGPLMTGSDTPLDNPSDLAFAFDGRLIIVDSGNDRLVVCRVLRDQP